jgi:hypothetical protein
MQLLDSKKQLYEPIRLSRDSMHVLCTCQLAALLISVGVLPWWDCPLNCKRAATAAAAAAAEAEGVI